MCDEHPDSINDGFLQANPHTDVAPSQWDDLPATYHAGACGFAFADGHSEIHKFKSAGCTILPVLTLLIRETALFRSARTRAWASTTLYGWPTAPACPSSESCSNSIAAEVTKFHLEFVHFPGVRFQMEPGYLGCFG